MNELIGKAPFFRLLLPVICTIASSRFLPLNGLIPAALTFAGLLLMLLSLLRDERQQFNCRWFFGAGTFLFLSALTLFQCREQEKHCDFHFPTSNRTYLAVLLEIPEQKERSVQCPVQVAPPFNKKMMLYLEKNESAARLLPGDEIIFTAQPVPFRNFGNPGEWDYAGYMRNKGFVGRSFVAAGNWERSGRKVLSPTLTAQRCRLSILRFYRSLGLEEDNYAFIAAVTLGYKAYLPDNIKEAFRASGTAHLLAVSGLHTGVIYLLLSFLLSFLGNKGTGLHIRQWLIIGSLWCYAFLTGLSPSVTRAVIMLSLYCLSRLKGKRGFTSNTLAAAAFLILIFHPHSLFDISFQMSFGAVFSILWFQPRIAALLHPKNRVATHLWELMTLSLSAQLGLFPMVLHYFGTFPTWFFLSNILVVPLMGLIFYSLLPMLFTGWLQASFSCIPEWLPSLFRQTVQLLTSTLLGIVKLVESLPRAQLTGLKITLPQSFLLLLFIFLFSQFLHSRHPRTLIIALTALLSFQWIQLWEQAQSAPPRLVVSNSPPASNLSLYIDGNHHLFPAPDNGFLPYPHKRVLRLSDGSFDHFPANSTFPVDILILSHYCCFNTDELCRLFQPSLIVLDSSLPPSASSRISATCIISGIPVHDVRQKGAYSLFF